MMADYLHKACFLFLLMGFIWVIRGCDDPASSDDDDKGPMEVLADSIDPEIPDDYSHISHIDNFSRWGHHNVHDPTLIKHDGHYYMYSTDVFFGGGDVPWDDPRREPKIPIRRSEDLVDWQPIGHVFEEMPQDAVDFLREQQPSYRPEAIWAPFILKTEDEFRLYYSVPLNDEEQGAYLGLATAPHPEGPWENQGLVLPTYTGDDHNGIDPAVIVDRDTGRHWLFHGSWRQGIFVVELDPQTGFRIDNESVGTIVATRPRVDGSAALEGAEVLYRPENDMYYLFVSYDWLMEPYNVRVGRAENPEGPYYDMNGRNMGHHTNNFPKITAQYRFDNHYGWKGVGHTGLLRDDDGDYYLATQGRLGGPSPNEHLMNLHLRRMFWTSNEWPVVSPQRYAGMPESLEINYQHILGDWEHISLDLTFEKNESQIISFTTDGEIDGLDGASWSFNDSRLTINPGDQEPFDAHIFWGWDWENERITLLFTGLNEEGIGQWGKKAE